MCLSLGTSLFLRWRSWFESLQICNCFRGKETFCFGRTKVYHAVATYIRLCLVESEISHAVVSNQKNHFSRRSGMLLVSHLGRHSMVHSHGFNIDDPVSNLINTRIRPFYVCSKPCSTSTAPNVPVVGGTFRWNSGVRGSPNWFFSLKHDTKKNARSTSLEFQFLRARLKEFFGGQVVKNSKNRFGYPVIWKIQWGNSSPPRSKSLPQYHSLVTSWNVVYFEPQILTNIYRGWLSDMATNQNRVGSGPSLQKRNVVRNLWSKNRRPRHHHHHQRVQKHLNHDTFWIFRFISNF